MFHNVSVLKMLSTSAAFSMCQNEMRVVERIHAGPVERAHRRHAFLLTCVLQMCPEGRSAAEAWRLMLVSCSACPCVCPDPDQGGFYSRESSSDKLKPGGTLRKTHLDWSWAQPCLARLCWARQRPPSRATQHALCCPDKA